MVHNCRWGLLSRLGPFDKEECLRVEFVVDVRPVLLRAHAEGVEVEGLDRIFERRAHVLLDGVGTVFGPSIVPEEETGWSKGGETLLDDVKFEGACNSIRCATAHPKLVVDLRQVGSEIDLRAQFFVGIEGEGVVTRIEFGQIYGAVFIRAGLIVKISDRERKSTKK